MAIDVDNVVPLNKYVRPVTVPSVGEETPFIINATSADATGCEVILAGTADKRIIITRISVLCASAITVTIGAGKTGAAVTTPIWGPLPFNVAINHVWEFTAPYPLAVNTDLTMDASGAGAICVTVEGWVV